MSSSSVPDPAEAVRRKQQLDAERLFQRLGKNHLPDLIVNYTLENSSVTIPGLLVRVLTLAVLFRLNSPKKWHAALREPLLPEPLRRWLDIEELADMADRATVDWIRPKVLLDTLSWQVAEILTLDSDLSIQHIREWAPFTTPEPRERLLDGLRRNLLVVPHRSRAAVVADAIQHLTHLEQVRVAVDLAVFGVHEDDHEHDEDDDHTDHDQRGRHETTCTEKPFVA